MPTAINELDVKGKTGTREGDARWYGVYLARVLDIRDPEGRGRIKISVPSAADESGRPHEAWARLVTLFAGNHRGSWFIPDVDDEVMVAFEGGQPEQPFVLGSLWKSQDKPPASMDGNGTNAAKILRSRNGVQITLDDRDGQERLVLETPAGAKLTLADGPSSIEIADANGNSAKFESSGITLLSMAKVNVQATQISLSASVVTVDAGMSTFSGVVRADTVITNSVVSSSYTPGAGNLW
jgi:uncharacterized protein involved in type VI secretion and phage assembly